MMRNHLRRWHRARLALDGRGRLRLRLRLGVESRGVGLLDLCELLEERLRRVKFEGQSWLADCDGRRLLAHLLPLEIALEGVQEQTVMRDAVPVEDFLLLLSSNAVVLVEEVEERALWLFKRSIGAGLEVSQI